MVEWGGGFSTIGRENSQKLGRHHREPLDFHRPKGFLAMETNGEVLMIEAARDEPARVLVKATDSQELVWLTTASPLVLDVALSAFLFGSTAIFETYENSCLLRRIHPFSKGNGFQGFPDDDVISRIATQGNLSGDHLEVFLKKGENEVAFNVFDPLLQRLLLAAHRQEGISFNVTTSGDALLSARVGRPFVP